MGERINEGGGGSFPGDLELPIDSKRAVASAMRSRSNKNRSLFNVLLTRTFSTVARCVTLSSHSQWQRKVKVVRYGGDVEIAISFVSSGRNDRRSFGFTI